MSVKGSIFFKNLSIERGREKRKIRIDTKRKNKTKFLNWHKARDFHKDLANFLR